MIRSEHTLTRGGGFARRISLLVTLLLVAGLAQAETIRSLAISPGSVAGGAASTGKVTLSKKAGTGGSTVSHSSSNSAVAVPGSVTVPSGATSATFILSTSPVATNTVVKIKGMIGSDAVDADLTVRNPKLSDLTLNRSTLIAGNSGTGTVTLGSAAPAGGFSVKLTSSNSALTVPKTVVENGGSQTATFDFATDSVGNSTSARVTAVAEGAEAATDLKINAAALTMLTFNPSNVAGGATSTGTVSLDGQAPRNGLYVNLSCKQLGVTMPKSVTILAGTSHVSFTITTQAVSKEVSATVDASHGATSLHSTLTISPVSLSSFTLNTSSVVGDTSVTGIVNLDGPAPAGGLTFNVFSNQPSVVVPLTETISAAKTRATFTVVTTPVASKTQAMVKASFNGSFIGATLTVNPPGILGLTISPVRVVGGNSSTGTFTLNGQAPTGGTMILLSSTVPSAAVPSSMTVAAGSTTGTFPITTLKVSAATSATITGTDACNTGTNALLKITPPSSSGSSGWTKFRANAMNTGLGMGTGADGTVLWSMQTSNQTSWSSPAIDPDGTIYVGSGDTNVYAISSSGTLK